MKTQITCLLLLVGMMSATAQKRSIDVGSFNKISYGVPGTLYLTQGSENELIVDCSDKAFERLEFKMDDGKLKIRNKNSKSWSWKNWDFNNEKITVYVTMRDIRGVSVGGSGKVIGKNEFNTGDMYLSVSGSGSMEIETNSDDVDLSISGSGKIYVSGSADEAEVSISGSGKIKGDDFAVKTVDASISGSGSCYITAKEELDASISGSGSVYYKGNPDRVISKASGSGKMRKM